jgi:hypothetical protein
MSQDVQVTANFLCDITAILNVVVKKDTVLLKQTLATLLLCIHNVPGSKPDTGSPD